MRAIRETLAMAGLVLQMAILACYWKQMPRVIAVHFNALGAPDSYGDKSTILMVPVITSLLYGLLTLLCLFPRSFNYPVKVTAENRPRLQAIAVAMLGWLKAELTASLAYIVWAVVRHALGRAQGLGLAFLPVMLSVIAATVITGIVGMRRAA